MAAVETTGVPDCVKACALLMRVKRKAAWFRVLAAEADVLGWEAEAAAFDDALSCAGRDRLEARRDQARTGAEDSRLSLRAAFVDFRSIDAEIVAGGGLPAEVDPNLDTGEVGLPAQILEAARNAFPETCSTAKTDGCDDDQDGAQRGAGGHRCR